MLVSTSGAGKYASALAASIPNQPGMTSSALLGQSDGGTDLAGTSACGSSTCPDYAMNDTYSAATGGNTVQTGLLDLSNGGALDLSSATSLTFKLALSFGQSSGGIAAATGAEETLQGTLNDQSTMLGTYVRQWNSFVDSLRAPPAVSMTRASQQAR